MTAIVRLFAPADWPFAAQHTKAVPHYDTTGVVCCDDTTGELYGVVVLCNLTPNGVQTHIAFPRFILCKRAGLFEAGYDLAFNTLGKQVAYGLTPSSNRKAITLLQRMGWRILTNIKDAFDTGIDFVVSEMRCENVPTRNKTNAQLDLFRGIYGRQ